MKKKITICLAVVLTVALAISVLTACSLFGGDNNQNNNNNNQNETKTLNASESSSELSKAIAASIAKDNYSIKVVGTKDQGWSIVTNIEHDADTQHITATSEQNYLGVTTNLYAETYFFVYDGKYYTSARLTKNGSFSNPTELSSKAEFDTEIAEYLLNSKIGTYTLDASAEVTYTGTKKGTEVDVTTTSVAEVNGIRTELFTSYKIKNGLVTEVLQRESEYDNTGAATVMAENVITVKYDIGDVELNASIHVG